MLSNLSTLLDKAFVLGFVLPALLFVAAALALFGCPAWLHDACAAKSGNPFADLTYAALVVYVVAIALAALNYSLYRIVRGYTGPFAWITGLRARHVRRLRAASARIALKDDRGQNSSVDTWQLLARYPREENEVEPTAFGNALRAVEVYPAEIYGADAISLWPRLLTVVPPAFQAQIDDAKSRVDFFFNLSVLSCILAATLIVWSVVHVGDAHALDATVATNARSVVVLVAAAVLAYLIAIAQIDPWGQLVNAAFDCYLPALAAQLGYVLPASADERRAFWSAVSVRALYRVAVGEQFTLATTRPPGGPIGPAAK